MALHIENFRDILKAVQDHGAQLVAVSKKKPAEDILALYREGQRVFGENYVQELLAKQPALPADIRWHFIGHLQRNKVKYIAPFVSLIQTVDSLALLREIDRQARKCARVIPCLVEVHIAREPSKTGLSPDAVVSFIEAVLGDPEGFSHVCLHGLMAMASFTAEEEIVRGEFHRVRDLLHTLRERFPGLGEDFKELSMGMSADYHWALEEGSTLIRVGSLLFGSRDSTPES